MKAEVISVGTELLIGHIDDSNATYLSHHLTSLGIDVHHRTAVGDRAEDITAVIEAATRRADVVIMTGGLGPTVDDITRDALATVAGEPLELCQDMAESIRARFALHGRDMPERNISQAMIPKGAVAIPNECGTAAGICIQINACDVIAMPGVPSEMKAMFENWVSSYLTEQLGGSSRVVTRMINTFGSGESAVDHQISDLIGARDHVDTGLLVSGGVVSVRITARGSSVDEANGRIDVIEDELRSRLGKIVFGVDDETLEEALGKHLIEHRMTLAVAESCTGGLIAHRLTNVPGISQCFLEGLVTYSNASKVELLRVPEELIKHHGAVSDQVAAAMAKGVLRRSGADISAAITGIAGPDGGTAEKPVGLVYSAIATGDDVCTSRHFFTGVRERIKDRASKTLLNLLRLKTLQLAKSSKNT